MLFISCKKDDSPQLKDYDYYKANLSKDMSFNQLISGLNSNVSNLSSSINNIELNNNLKGVNKYYFTKSEIDKRVKVIIKNFDSFKSSNKDFFNLTKNQQIILFRSAMKEIETTKLSSYLSLIKTSVDDFGCYHSFNHSYNICGNNRNMGVIQSFMNVDPIAIIMSATLNELNWNDCLDDAADAFQVCSNGGYL